MSLGAIEFLAGLSHALLAIVFTSAALSKVLGTADLRRTLERLGVRRAASMPVAIGIIAAELVAGVGLFVVPERPWPRILAAALAIAFAGAGIKALRMRQRIPCNCFGSTGRGLLGRRQVALLPGWLLLVTLAQWRSPDWEPRQGLLGLAALVVALACRQIPVRLWLQLRADRIALAESWYPAPSAATPKGDASQ
ncbi:MAG: MauE/DoxX family redox-associated membrane protein [Egibacteraceae bacterium]